MKIYYIFLFLILINIFGFINCKDDYIPVLFWTSPEISEGPALDLKKINRKLFTNYLIKKLSKTKALVLVFMEQILNVDDFRLMMFNKTAAHFPFSTAVNYRTRFFPHVENPLVALKKLSSQGYKWEQMQTNWKSHATHPSILIMEFESINNKERENALGKHQELMTGVTKEVENTRKHWICIYTGRHAKSRENQIPTQLSSWYIDAESASRPKKPLYLYRDRVLGLAMLTTGPIQLHLPTYVNYSVKYLENYIGASFTGHFEDAMDLVIWFTRYTLTFSMSLLNNDWFIQSVNIQKEDGQNLRLWPKIRILRGKSDLRFTMFQSKGKPTVKVIISRYKVVGIQEKESLCVNEYSVPFLCTIMFIATGFVSIVWTILLYASKIPISTRPKFIQISIEALISRKYVSDLSYHSFSGASINRNYIT